MIDRFQGFPGDVSFYTKNMVTGAEEAFEADKPLTAASVIKLPMMIEAFRQFEAGELDPAQLVSVLKKDRVPPCGVLTFMHNGLAVTARDLVVLMIIVSDNMATNLLMDLLGIDKVNRTLEAHGAKTTRLRRKMFDLESSRRGIQNTITAREIGMLLEGLYQGKIVSKKSSAEMIDILKGQQLNGKIPYRVSDQCEVAHKTGEDSGTTHDVGIVYAKEPFVACYLSNNVDVLAYERLMQDTVWEIVHAQG